MKGILLVACLFAVGAASAQQGTTPVMPNPGISKLNTLPKKPATVIDRAKLLHTLPNGNKVYALPQCNMPCVVPNITQMNMPVVKPPTEYTIPNPAYPSAGQSRVLTQEQMKKLKELKPQFRH